MSAVLAAVLAISQMSCLSESDQADLNAFNTALQKAVQVIDKDKQTVLELKAELDKYRVEFLKVVEDVKAKKVPAESGLALMAKIMVNINSTQARIADVQKLIDENTGSAQAIAASVKKLQEKDIPWQYWLLPIGTALAGVAGMFIPGISPLAGMLATANQQIKATREASGSMSRTMDTMVTTAGAAPNGVDMAKLKEDLMRKEQDTDELAEKSLYDEIRASARANLL